MSQTPRPGDQQSHDEPYDTDHPNSARIWNYWLGGKDNSAIDREVGEQIKQIHPEIELLARQDRLFLQRAVRHLAEEEGVRQFLDVGTGLPTMDNTHEVAQRVAPDARVVYVDNDQLVLTHARALLTSTSEGTTHYIDADLRDPSRILEEAAKKLDFDQPIGLMLVEILQHLTDDEEAYRVVHRLVDGLPPGSWLAIGHDTADFHGADVRESMRRFMDAGGPPICARDLGQIARFFDGLELAAPGIVSVSRWRPEDIDPDPFGGEPPQVAAYGAVGRKP